MISPYIGHPSQLYGVEEVRLVGGKGDGMRLLQVNNASGLSFTVAADRCADVYRLCFKGVNMGYPFLSEHAQLEIPSRYIYQGTAAVSTDEWKTVTPPVPDNPEICYRHYYDGMDMGSASVYNPQISKGLKISFSAEDFPCLIQWNKFACRDYALGLEPRSFRNGGRAAARERGELTLLRTGQSKTYEVRIGFFAE